MFLVKRSWVLALLLMGIAGGRAYAQDFVEVKVPFDFLVKGHMLHAGTYAVTIDAAAAGVVSRRDDRGKEFAFAFTIPASGHDPAGDEPVLVFNHLENKYVLSQIWESGTQGREVSKR
jgi:hypothetical protein